jgi:hypothetical protein
VNGDLIWGMFFGGLAMLIIVGVIMPIRRELKATEPPRNYNGQVIGICSKCSYTLNEPHFVSIAGRDDSGLLRFTCRCGHTWSDPTLDTTMSKEGVA